MTHLEKFRQEIQTMSIKEIAETMLKCKLCVHSGNPDCFIYDCEESIKKYLDSEFESSQE